MLRDKYILILCFFIALQIGHTQYADLTVVIDNIKKIEGVIQIGLYNNKESFPKVGKEYKRIRVDVTSTKFEHTIEKLDTGYYAIALFHDNDGNGEINKNFLGIPKEDYGFSNNIKPVLSAPPYKKVKIKLTRDTLINIILR